MNCLREKPKKTLYECMVNFSTAWRSFLYELKVYRVMDAIENKLRGAK